MTIPQAQQITTASMDDLPLDENGWWSADIDISRTPSPGIPAKKMRMTLEDISQDYREAVDLLKDNEFNNILRAQRAPDVMGYGDAETYRDLWALPRDSADTHFGQWEHVPAPDVQERRLRSKMKTGCIPCLMKGIACDPQNPGCKLAMSDDWNLNYDEDETNDVDQYPTPNSSSLTLFRPDTKWRRNWRERHSLNFFVNFSAPQMAGFFDSTFWQRMVIQTSYNEPAILHAITAIGALHECIMQRVLADEKRKARAIEFALSQCNKAISCLTSSQSSSSGGQGIPNSRLALTTCVLFTCFEAMQGRCDSAVNHALQGRRLLQATGKPNATSMSVTEEDDLEQMRPIVERLEVQATALLDKGRRPEIDTSDEIPPLPPIEFIFSLDNAHNTLHLALNGVMRFMQGFHPTAPRDHIAVTMAEKYLRYAPWFAKWEVAFTTYLAERRDYMSNMDLKRAMVLKANHLVGTMLASVDQSAGPIAYDAFEAEFRAIVELAREVLSSFSCPPLPTLTGGSSGTPYLSFSLWVTDPLWMAISRCRNPSIRQAAFTLLSQNPRQEGIWHAGPQLSNNKYMRRVEAGPTSVLKEVVKGDLPPDSNKRKHGTENGHANGCSGRSKSNSPERTQGSTLEVLEDAPVGGKMRVRAEWVDLRSRIDQWSDAASKGTKKARPQGDEHIRRYESHCTGNCAIPSLAELQAEMHSTND